MFVKLPTRNSQKRLSEFAGYLRGGFPSLVQACSLNQNVRFIRKLANLKNILVSICRSPYTLNRVPHNNQHTMPFLFGKLRYCFYDSLVYFVSIGFSETYNQNTMMLFITILRKSLVCCNQ